MSAKQKKDSLQQIYISSWGWTQRGDGREDNQDAFLNWPERRIWAVADGVGSSDHGAAASRYLMKALMFLKDFSSMDEGLDKTREILKDANEFLCLQGRVGGSAASTVTVLVIHEREAAFLWAGDSRGYMLRGDILYQCTRDHTLRQEKIDTGELTAPEAKRMIRGNIITSAVGMKQDMKLEEVRLPMRAGDRFLLCTDGLSKLLSSEALGRRLAGESARSSADCIVESVSYLSQPDNLTFVTVFLSA
jgi:serine/threonine-protein phosphatase Stp1